MDTETKKELESMHEELIKDVTKELEGVATDMEAIIEKIKNGKNT